MMNSWDADDYPLTSAVGSSLPQALRAFAFPSSTTVRLSAGESILIVRSIRNPTQAELDRLLTAIKPPEVEEEE